MQIIWIALAVLWGGMAVLVLGLRIAEVTRKEERPAALFTVYPLYRDHEEAPQQLKRLMGDICWMDNDLIAHVYVVNINAHVEPAAQCRQLCLHHPNFTYCTAEEFTKILEEAEK